MSRAIVSKIRNKKRSKYGDLFGALFNIAEDFYDVSFYVYENEISKLDDDMLSRVDLTKVDGCGKEKADPKGEWLMVQKNFFGWEELFWVKRNKASHRVDDTYEVYYKRFDHNPHNSTWSVSRKIVRALDRVDVFNDFPEMDGGARVLDFIEKDFRKSKNYSPRCVALDLFNADDGRLRKEMGYE